MVELFAEYKAVILVFHLLGFALGYGGAMVSDFLFFKFLKDLKLTTQEIYVMTLVSTLVWTGLFVLLLSGIGIFLSDPAGYIESDKFLLKMFVVVILTLNGFGLHYYIKPRLKKIEWNAKKPQHNTRDLKRLAFAGGAISMISWLSATVLGSIDLIPVSLTVGIEIYFLILLITLVGSQIAEYLFFRFARSSN
tara:strand:- start:1193 stop:1771 length:579 start_codon:yes stop_codon:yes gene_type:complete